MQTTDENVGTFASATVSMSGSETRMSRQVDPQKVLTVQITGTLSASDTLTVDDVVLWRSQLGSCSER
jgi:hypothetical protein